MEKVSTPKNTFTARILVVDDHPSTANTLARAISQLGGGIEIISATSGKEALQMVKGGSIDILITDMMMPGMSGLELIEQFQSHPAGRPTYTILVTAYDVPGLKETAKRLKVNETIVKPVRPELICQIVGGFLESMGHSPAPAKTAETPSFKILIADDAPDTVTLMIRYMQNEGYDCITASNGLEVLEKTRAEMPDLVLLDINMPEKDGFTALEEIRSDPAIQHIPVIIFTAARLNPGDVQSGLNLGADDYITKPFDRRELFARIRTKLRVKEAEDAIRRRNRELSVLPEIGRELSARLDLDELLKIVLRRSAETTGACWGGAVIFKKEGAHLQWSFSTLKNKTPIGMDSSHIEKFTTQLKENDQGLIIDDVQKNLNWQAAADNPIRSVVVAPMFGRDRLLGLLMIAHEKADYFKTDHLSLLQAIASQTALVVENVQLRMAVTQEWEKLKAVIESTEEAVLMLGSDGKISLINPAGKKLFENTEVKQGSPLPEDQKYSSFIHLLEETRRSNTPRSAMVPWSNQRTYSVRIIPFQESECMAILQDVTHSINQERTKNELSAAS